MDIIAAINLQIGIEFVTLAELIVPRIDQHTVKWLHSLHFAVAWCPQSYSTMCLFLFICELF
jgi:hypothetical protein